MEGIFNTTGNTASSTSFTYSPENEQEAWIAVMHAFIAVDDDVADEELEELAQTLASKKLFEGHDVLAYSKKVFYAHTQVGSKQMIDNAINQISVDYRATFFAHVIQLVLSDCVLENRERELIQYLYSALDIEEKLAHKIIDVILILNKGNIC